ncbi:MAG: acyl-CoA dehydrogenase family protein, partial [Phycisphaerales bacterium]|nr:acyl-CoA dehydrogenase family protein [Phycisphaerales bacterium]
MTFSQAAYNPEMDPALRQLTKNLARLATNDDISGDWPEASIQHLTDAGAWAWIIPERFGGIQLDPVSMVRGYEAVGAGSLACLLILS